MSQGITVPCPRCRQPRDFSHLREQVTDWQEMIPILAGEICSRCRWNEISRIQIHLCTRADVLPTRQYWHRYGTVLAGEEE